MRVVIGSAFRNSTSYLDRYFIQLRALQKALVQRGDSLRLIAAEGDSLDNTHTALLSLSRHLNLPLQFVDCTHGGPHFGSTEAPERMVALSKVGNAIFGGVNDTDDVLVYVESDLTWEAEAVTTLIDDAWRWEAGYDVFAPMVMAGEHFYDIWGFRKIGGVRFSPWEHQQFNGNGDQSYFYPLDSAGSCLVMRAAVARKCRILNDYCLVGWCADAKQKGFHIAMDRRAQVNQR